MSAALAMRGSGDVTPHVIEDVVIAGAGIGGLTLAVALRRRGIRVRVLERTSRIVAAGAGLALQPNAMLRLDRLGLARDITAAGRVLTRAAILDSAVARSVPKAISRRSTRDWSARGGAAPWTAARHSRQCRLPGRGCNGHRRIRLQAGQRPRHRALRRGRTVRDATAGGSRRARSTVRAQFVGDGEPVYSGYTSRRGATPAGSVAPPLRMSETWGRGERFGIADIGCGELYWFAVANAPAGSRDTDVKEALLCRFGRWHPPIHAVIDATPPERILVACRNLVMRLTPRSVMVARARLLMAER